MAIVTYRNETTTDPDQIKNMLASHGIPYECWGTKDASAASDDQVLNQYKDEIESLKANRGYVSCDLIALRPDTPNLDTLLAKFDKEHHHTEDEVRFTVAGEGVFEIQTEAGDNVKFTAQPGDLIVVPANRRHLFYLTEERTIRCIRLFKNTDGWEAIY